MFSSDADLARRLTAYAGTVVDILPQSQSTDVKRTLQQRPFGILLLDLRNPESASLLPDVVAEWPQTLIIAIGESRSDPLLEALDVGVFGVLAPDADQLTVEMLLRQSSNRQRLALELHLLQHPTPAPLRAAPGAGRPPVRDSAMLRHLVPPLRRFDNVDSLLEGIVNGIASTAVVLRAGIFAAINGSEAYTFQAGVGCLDDTRQQVYRRDHPLVRWLELNAQAVSRDRLPLLRDTSARMLLEPSLDAFGAELVVPLHGRVSMLGWIFLGRRATGGEFDDADIQDVMLLAEHVSTVLENVRLYREVAMQKVFAETLLSSLPTGVIATDVAGSVTWFNEAAAQILELKRTDILAHPVELLGSRLAHALRTCLAGLPPSEDLTWHEPHTNRHLALRVTRLGPAGSHAGAVAFVYDRTREHLLNRRQQEVERAAFWTELAASMSHEIRNPMVTIKTFAQLLPERYSDPEFRTEFSGLMSREVDRLDAIIQQINSFANRPALKLEWINPHELLEEGRNLAILRVPDSQATIAFHFDDPLPRIRGDRHALIESVAHILTNSLEALVRRPDSQIQASVAAVNDAGGGAPSLHIAIRDNGPGLDAGIRDNVFSPFCTTKSRAMGLGLPLVQRTAADHHGHVTVESGTTGTCVTLVLPLDAKLEGNAA